MSRKNKVVNFCFFIILNLFFVSPSFAQIASPKPLSGLILWMTSDSGLVMSSDTSIASVAQWTDLSGNNNHARQDSISNQPQLISNAINGKPLLSFDGSASFMKTPAGLLDNIAELSMFMVLKVKEDKNAGIFGTDIGYDNLELTSQGSGRFRIRNSNASLKIVQSNLFSIDSFTIVSAVAKNRLGYVYKNGINATTDALAVELPIGDGTQQSLGRYASDFGDFYGKFEIAEFIIYNNRLSDLERIDIENYLRLKYTNPVDLGLDIIIPYGFCDTTLDAGSGFTSYLWSTSETSQTINVNKSGDYWVQATDIFGVETTDTIKVNYTNIDYIGNSASCVGSTKIWNTLLSKSDYSFVWQNSTTDSLFDITPAGNYDVTVTDTIGCSSTSEVVSVFIDNFPTTASLGPDTTLCVGNKLYLKTGKASALTYLWSDGSSNDSLSISVGGTYSLTVTDTNGCVANESINITMAGGTAPVADFSFTGICLSEVTSFIDNSSAPSGNSIVSRIWSFGDGSPTSTITSPTHTYASIGTYSVSLLVTTNTGCASTKVKELSVLPIPTVSLTASNFCERDSTLFMGTAIDLGYPITQWNWDFNDPSSGVNNSSALQNPKHLFENSGSYNVSLSIQNVNGCSDNTSSTIVIAESPSVAFSNTVLCESETIEFTDETTLSPGMVIQSTVWDLNTNYANSIIYLLSPSHVFPDTGIVIVTHTITDTSGCSNTLQKNLTVHPKPKALYVVGPICADVPVSFTDTSTITVGSITNWYWDYGNGLTSAVQNDTQTFVFGENPIVELLVTSDQGCVDSITKNIITNPLPVASFSPSVAYGSPPLAVSYTNTSTGANSLFVWDFGNGLTDSIQNPSTSYGAIAFYTVELTATNSFGCIDTASTIIEVVEYHLDVAIDNITTVINDNYLQVYAQISNKGSEDVISMEVSLNINDEPVRKQYWTGLLARGGVIIDTLGAAIYLEDPNRFVCVTALKPNNLTDENLADNEMCKAVEGSEFTVLNPYPVPAGDVITLPLLIPSKKELSIKISDARGRVLESVYDDFITDGLQMITISTAFLPKGFYTFIITYDGETVIKKFIVD